MDHLAVSATLRDFVAASGALEATAVDPDGTIVTAELGGALELERPGADGPEPVDTAAATPLALAVAPRRLPAFDVDELAGEVSGPIGALEHAAECVRALSDAIGEQAVAFVRWPTSDESPFAISARGDEGFVLAIGDESFEMDPGWPADVHGPAA